MMFLARFFRFLGALGALVCIAAGVVNEQVAVVVAGAAFLLTFHLDRIEEAIQELDRGDDD